MRSNVLDAVAISTTARSGLEELQLLTSALESTSQLTRQQAARSLHRFVERLTHNHHLYPDLRLLHLQLPGGALSLRLVLHEAVFEPEQWSRTFAESLLKQPQAFEGKTIVEMGTGSGWVSIALLLTTGAASILGLDLNPVAVAIARVNAWLNGTNADGSYVFTQAGVPLPEAFDVAVSDLLTVPLRTNRRFDHVIGCIPQMLHPDPSFSLQAAGTASALYDLSNYCAAQGLIEDRFGLPLIARALDEAKFCLNEPGTVTLILGGRPGMQVIETMFKRRGYNPQVVACRRIPQAQDTSIASLVELERAYKIEFHFYQSLDAQESISATQAQQLLEDGVCPYHDLFVIQSSLD